METGEISKLLNMNAREMSALQRATKKLRDIQPTKPTSRSRSGQKGIYYQFDKKRWNVNIPHKGEQIYVGISNCIESAKAMQKRRVKQLILENKLPADYTL